MQLALLLYRVLANQKTTPFDEENSSEEDKPFVGRYHHVLRKRKNDPRELDKQNKLPYKKKRIVAKNQSWMHQLWKIQTPLAQYHVYNFHNILAINEHSLLDPNCEESFVSSKFYMKKVNKVTIDRGCLILNLQNLPQNTTPIPYLCEKLKSLGDSRYLQFAQTIQYVEQTLPEINQKIGTTGPTAEQKLSDFLSEMGERPFFSQYSPEMLIISRAFLNMLGYDIEELAIESIKYKTILQYKQDFLLRFFSAEHYTQIIHKHLQNILLLKDFLEGAMDLDEFCNKSMIVCQDYIYTRTNKQIKCNFFGGTSKQLTPYIEIQEFSQPSEESLETRNARFVSQVEKIEEFKESYKQKEFDLLKKLILLPRHEDPEFKGRICGYKEISSPEQISSDP